MWRLPVMGRKLLILTSVLLAGVGCDRGAAVEATSPMTVRVLVRDINIREAGVDCAGTGPYVYLHRSAEYRLTDAEGRTLVRGELPSGTSMPAFEEDLEVKRVPTYCAFAIPVTVPERTDYRLAVGDQRPIELTVDRDNAEGPSLVAVVP
ncbi:hypothetical protein AB0C02_26815 [Micromonospora sp. NPDC048999]|uniref:hypothetical protein n=1 Tax=Micromonospora sp. NPDC048999 TaxID=3155391 RepID=UPI0033C2783B